ncbi:DUF4293 domain-containing protein [Paenibacillus sp. MER TA 81-3]|uniref:DUF4293 domain-containing protein n=1 Tax=Paenibacillus sp. MER TA 81-3 TaxID=2939573 RepID=UPI00203CB9A4|nr:DUF4293 domain-containing protein [Paenibacillus sp. MER TA 81-3]MCM3338701.1 DUF4293 domain-containing protein [Paenibacillus sp. MER TA 81-3]
MLYFWFILGAVVFVLLLGTIFFYKNRKKRQRVVSMASYAKKKPVSGQPCSYCKRKAVKLTFYAGNHGSVVGVCASCRKRAERQGLLPI